jgi:hypothetical protein
MATTSSRRDQWQVAVVVAITLGLMAWILRDHISAGWHAKEAQQELVAFTSELSLGMTRDEVRRRFSAKSRSFRDLQEVDGKVALVGTPLTFGATNWQAWLDFTDQRLSSVRIRTLDGEHSKPNGSPPDVGMPPPRRN